MKNILSLFILLIITPASYSQLIKGQITDNKNEPIPYVVVYDETSYVGTTSNADGYYELKLNKGNHSLVFKAFGYNLIRKSVNISDDPLTFNVKLYEQPVTLKEIIVTPGKEDPAYAIMRKVIGLAPKHLNQVKNYTADVYLRGTANIIKMPKLISKHAQVSVNGVNHSLKAGDSFIEESINQIKFQAPDKYEQKVISIKSTFPWSDNEVNPMGMINSSLYEPEIEGIISPLASNAFHYYKFKYEGFFEEGEKVVFKIRVIPKQNSQKLMKGYIYIIDQLWCLHSVDVQVSMFFGDLKLKTIYSKIKEDVWMPVSYQFYLDASIIGIKANYKYNSSIKFKEVVLNEKKSYMKDRKPLPEKTKVSSANKEDIKKIKTQKEIEEILSKEALTNRDMVKLSSLMDKESNKDTTRSLDISNNSNNKVIVEKDAVKKDTSFWNSVRPIPLSAVESNILLGNDSTLMLVKKDTTLSDTKEKVKKKEDKVINFILSGSGSWLCDSTVYLKYNGLIGINKFDFNTVDGFIYRQTFSLEKKIDTIHSIKINPGIAYAFNRERLMWWTNINFQYAPLRGGNLRFYIGSISSDYNNETGINSTVNSVASLFFRRNYLKLYQQNQAFISNKIDLANGLNLSVSFGYRIAQPLSDNSDYSFFYRNEREYTRNIPVDNISVISRNVYNEEAYIKFHVEYTPKYYYKIIRNRKYYQYSKFPTIYLSGRTAIPGIINSTADYSLIEAGLKQHKEWGMMHSFSWNIKSGFFLNRSVIFSMDDKYFDNTDIPVTIGNTEESFRLVPYYKNFTNKNFYEAHASFTTPYLLIKYLPFLSNKLWRENLYFNYLNTSARKHYWEIGYEVSDIFVIANAGIYAGFKETSYESCGFRISIDLDN